MINRVIWIILDSVGVGELPDASKFGDEGSHTFDNTVNATGVKLPNLKALGMGNIQGVNSLGEESSPIGNYGRSAELSNGKDTTVGHWEMAGIHSPHSFPTYPNGFPKEIMDEFSQKTGRGWLGNKPASGTAILDELGPEHMETGKLIIYTSGDSVFQIAAHEDIVPIDELYRYCDIAREMLKGDHALARVIARPFVGEAGKFVRTANRRDYSLSPPADTVLDLLKADGQHVIGVGKIEDIFNKQGITEALHTKDNMHGVDVTLDYMKSHKSGLIFTNLVEFDSAWGHRNNVKGYAGGLVDFDNRLPEIMESMTDQDILIINADHGCDPTTASTDHSREYIPLLVYGKDLKAGVDLGTRTTFADIGQTIADILGVKPLEEGTSFKGDITK